MGVNAVNSSLYYEKNFSYGANYKYMFGRYLQEALPWWVNNMVRYNPASRMNVDFLSNMLNYHTAITGGPYAYSVVIPGSGNVRYNVMEFGLYPEHIMAGQRTNYYDVAMDKIKEISSNMSVETSATLITMRLNRVKDLGKFAQNKYLSDETKSQIKVLVNSAKAKSTLLEKYLKNEQGLSAEQLSSALQPVLDSAKSLVEQSDALYEELVVEITEAQEAESDALEAELENELDNDDVSTSPTRVGSATGTATGKEVTTLSEDTELTDVKKVRYGMNPTASIPSCNNADELSNKIMADDFTTKDKFTELFGKDKDINEKNIVEVLTSITDINSFVDKIAALKDGDKDYSSKALNEITKLLKARVQLLSNAGHLEATDKNLVNAHIANLGSYASNITGDKAKIASTLTTILNTLKDKGTEDVVKTAIETKQTEAKTEAEKDFRKAYAEDTSDGVEDKSYDATKTYVDFPDEITYLPNKKIFQVTITTGSTTKYFEAGNFKNLNKVIIDTADENIINKWKEIKAKLLEEPTTT